MNGTTFFLILFSSVSRENVVYQPEDIDVIDLTMYQNQKIGKRLSKLKTQHQSVIYTSKEAFHSISLNMAKHLSFISQIFLSRESHNTMRAWFYPYKYNSVITLHSIAVMLLQERKSIIWLVKTGGVLNL